MNRDKGSVLFGNEALEKLKEGVSLVANAVKVTLGGRGRNALISLPTLVKVTKDGVTVASYVDVEDSYARQGVRLLKQVALGTNKEVGDGTTTSVVLAQAIVERGLEKIKNGANPVLLQRGVSKAVDLVCEHLKQTSKKISDNEEAIKQVATVSANNDVQLGEMIVEAFKKVKYKGLVTFKESNTPETFLEVIEGIKYETGFTSPYFLTSGKRRREFSKPYILLTNKFINSMEEFGKGENNLLKRAVLEGKDLVIVCKDMDKLLEQTLILNHMYNQHKIYVVKAPFYGTEQAEALEDLAAVLGTKMYSAERDEKMDKIHFEELGSCYKLEVGLDDFIVTANPKNAQFVKERIQTLESLIKEERKFYTKKDIEKRVSILNSGIATIYVGAKTEVEAKEKIDRVEDAVNAVKSALQGGVLPGGGIALLQTSVEPCVECKEGRDFYEGFDIVNEALEIPFKTILENAGVNSTYIKKEINLKNKINTGYNVITEEVGDMYEMGIIDPAKVTISALQNAASVASTLLTTGCLILERVYTDLDGM
jgi:chaperonin GroEL